MWGLKGVLMDQAADASAGGAAGGAAGAAKADAGAAGASGADAGKADAGKAAGDAGKTVLEAGKSSAGADGKVEEGTAADGGKGYWPEDWLSRVSKNDEKVSKQLGRYASPEALAEAHIALKRRMDSGEFKAALPKNPTADDLKAWRKDNGIPEKPEAYDLKGIEVPEADREIVNGFLKDVAHAHNMTMPQARAALGAYYAMEKRNEEARSARDEEDRGKAIDAISAEWGTSTTRNKTLIENALSRAFPASVRDGIKSARLPDGTLLFNHADVLRAFLALELERNPTGIVAHAGDGELGKSMTQRYEEIQKAKSENRSAWNKNPANDKEEKALIAAMVSQGLMDNQGNLKKAA